MLFRSLPESSVSWITFRILKNYVKVYISNLEVEIKSLNLNSKTPKLERYVFIFMFLGWNWVWATELILLLLAKILNLPDNFWTGLGVLNSHLLNQYISPPWPFLLSFTHAIQFAIYINCYLYTLTMRKMQPQIMILDTWRLIILILKVEIGVPFPTSYEWEKKSLER